MSVKIEIKAPHLRQGSDQSSNLNLLDKQCYHSDSVKNVYPTYWLGITVS